MDKWALSGLMANSVGWRRQPLQAVEQPAVASEPVAEAADLIALAIVFATGQ